MSAAAGHLIPSPPIFVTNAQTTRVLLDAGSSGGEDVGQLCCLALQSLHAKERERLRGYRRGSFGCSGAGAGLVD